MKYLNKIIEYGLYLLFFLLPIQTRWIIKAGEIEYSTYSLYGTDILLLVILVLFFILKFSIFNFQTKSKIQNPNHQSLTWLFIPGFISASAVSIFFASDKLLALYKLGWLMLGMGLFWLIISINYNKLKLVYALLAGCFFQAVLGVWQFLFQSSFSAKWFGIALHNAADLGVSVVEAVDNDGVGERWLRAYGGLDHPNVLGGVVAIGILFLIKQIISTKQIKNFQFSIFNFQIIFNAKILKIILWLLLLIFFAALFFSFSRTAWLGLAVGLVVITASSIAFKNLFQQNRLWEAILIIGVLFFLLFSQYQNLIIVRARGEGRLEAKSTEERIILFKQARQLIKQSWLTGVGVGNYTLAIHNRIFVNQASYSYQPAHNTFFLVWAETGIIGLIFFACIIIYLIILNLKNQITNILNLALLSALVILLNFDHWLWSLHFGVLFFWLIMGMVYAGSAANNRNS